MPGADSKATLDGVGFRQRGVWSLGFGFKGLNFSGRGLEIPASCPIGFEAGPRLCGVSTRFVGIPEMAETLNLRTEAAEACVDPIFPRALQ